MKEDFLTRCGIRQRTLLRPSLFLLTQSTKSSLLTKLTTRPTTYSSSYGQILRHFITTADSYSPVTSKTKSSNHYTLDVPWSISLSVESKNLLSQQSSSNDSKPSLIKRVLRQIKRFLPN